MVVIMNKDLLPNSIVTWLETVLAGEVTDFKPRAGGGAVRMGAEVSIKTKGGEALKGFLAYDGGQKPATGIEEKYAREAAILRAVEPTNIRAPRLLATSAELRAHLFEFAEGEDRFIRLTDPEDAFTVVADYLHDLALLHKLDASSLELPGFGELQPVADYLIKGINTMKRQHMAGGMADPFIIYGLRWLERNIPDYDGPTVVVHGDAGPGNFLFQDNRVTAVLDWELAHYGDPMEDFAWMSIRAIIQAWVPFPRMLATYEKLSGIPVNLDRIRFYRVYTLLAMIIGSHRRYFQQTDTLAEQGRLGNGLMFMMVHRRAYVDGLADALGITLPSVELPEAGASDISPFIESLLAQLRDVIVPRSTDQVASETAKDMARLLKYIDGRVQMGDLLDEDELRDLNEALQASHYELKDARTDLVQHIENDQINDDQMIGILWRRVSRETAIAQGTMGKLSERVFPPLT